MLDLPAAPHADRRGLGFVLNEWGAARICVTVEHDQRGGARRMCCREQRRCRERMADRDEDRFALNRLLCARSGYSLPQIRMRACGVPA